MVIYRWRYLKGKEDCMEKKNIIIDTDPGIDDAFALAYAFNEDRFNILGITTVSGNNGIDRVTNNALKLVKFFDQDLGVYEGENRPFVREPDIGGGSCHGDDGLGGLGVKLPQGEAEKIHGVDFIIEMAEKYDDLTIVAIGPLTNVAKAIEKNPKSMARVKEIVSMGGGIGLGNVTDYAEFNYWADPEAAKLVFDFGLPITMVDLNATKSSYLSVEDFERMRDTKTEVGELLYEMQKIYTKFYKGWHNIDGSRIHDLLAMVIAADPSVGIGRYGRVKISTDDIRRGETTADFSGDGKNVYIIEGVDYEAYKQIFFEKVFKI